MAKIKSYHYIAIIAFLALGRYAFCQDLVLQDSIKLTAPVRALGQDSYGDIYVLTNQNQLCKIFSNWDSVYCIGGRGMSEEALLEPTAISVTSQQSIYVLDAAPRRIVLFNYNLKPARQVQFTDIEAGLDKTTIIPKSFAVGPSGDLFLLNAFDNRILKFNSGGRLEVQFGGTDYGQGRLLAPNELFIDSDYTVWATDPLRQQLSQFDFYGTWIQNWQPTVPFKWEAAKLSGKTWLFWNNQEVFLYSTGTFAGQTFHLEKRINNAEIQNNFLIINHENFIDKYVINR